MRPRVVPLALVPAFLVGCASRPFTPAVSVAFWSEDVPEARAVAVPHALDVARRWQLPPESPWAPYGKLTLVAALDRIYPSASLPDVGKLEVFGRAARAGERLGRAGLPPRTALFVDLRGAASAAFGAALSAHADVAPVLTFHNVPSENELVPAEETLAGLLAVAPRASARADAPPVFLLDAWRLAYRYDAPGDDVYDNRYVLGSADLPSAAALRARGISRFVYVVEDLDDAEVEEDDLHETFLAYAEAGLEMAIVDLAFLEGLRPGASWPELLAPRRRLVRPRYTLADDPVFYTRARAGFGLAYGRPLLAPGFRGGGAWFIGGPSGRGGRGGGGG